MLANMIYFGFTNVVYWAIMLMTYHCVYADSHMAEVTWSNFLLTFAGSSSNLYSKPSSSQYQQLSIHSNHYSSQSSGPKNW